VVLPTGFGTTISGLKKGEWESPVCVDGERGRATGFKYTCGCGTGLTLLESGIERTEARRPRVGEAMTRSMKAFRSSQILTRNVIQGVHPWFAFDSGSIVLDRNWNIDCYYRKMISVAIRRQFEVVQPLAIFNEWGFLRQDFLCATCLDAIKWNLITRFSRFLEI
jgi:hypothetical protein